MKEEDVRPPARSLYLSAEAALDPDGAPVAIVFGPENGAISEKLIYEAVTEAHMKHCTAPATTSPPGSSTPTGTTSRSTSRRRSSRAPLPGTA